MNPLYEVLAAGVLATEQALIDAGMPVPPISQAITHAPVLDCGCDALYVSLVQTANTQSENVAVFGNLVHHQKCAITTRRVTVEVLLSRCVYLQNPLTDQCWGSGDVTDMLVCADDVLPVPPQSTCDRIPHTKAEETAWLTHDRWILETDVPRLWTRALCQGHCNTPCETWERFGGTTKVIWDHSDRYDSGGCGGTLATYHIEFP